jgi:hypothetical protein
MQGRSRKMYYLEGDCQAELCRVLAGLLHAVCSELWANAIVVFKVASYLS